MKRIIFFLSVLVCTFANSNTVNAISQIDTNFNPNPIGFSVAEIELQEDQKILVGGSFVSIAGVNLPAQSELDATVVRLNPDGTLDDEFQPVILPGVITSMAIQANGRILIGTSVGLTRIDQDGNIDEDYQSAVSGFIGDIQIQDDGLAVVGGSFTNLIGGITRLNEDGSRDQNFEAGLGTQRFGQGSELISGVVRTIEFQSNLNRILIAGDFTFVDGERRYMIARLGPDGSIDKNFEPVILDGDDEPTLTEVFDIVVQPDGQILIGGQFRFIDGFPRNNYARLNSDGTLDQTFQVGSGALPFAETTNVSNIVLQPDGDILLSGSFEQLNGQTVSNFGRLNSDGTPDRFFQIEGSIGSRSDVLLQQNGDILISGRGGASLVRVNVSSPTTFLIPIILKLLEEE